MGVLSTKRNKERAGKSRARKNCSRHKKDGESPPPNNKVQVESDTVCRGWEQVAVEEQSPGFLPSSYSLHPPFKEVSRPVWSLALCQCGQDCVVWWENLGLSSQTVWVSNSTSATDQHDLYGGRSSSFICDINLRDCCTSLPGCWN